VGRRLLSPVATAISLIALVAPSAADAKARLQVRVAGTTARVVLSDNRPRQVRLLVDGRVVASGHRRRLSRVVKRLAPGRHVVVVRGRHRRTVARKAFVVRAVPTVEVVAPSVLVKPAPTGAGSLRLAGTLPLDQLTDLARSLRREDH